MTFIYMSVNRDWYFMSFLLRSPFSPAFSLKASLKKALVTEIKLFIYLYQNLQRFSKGIETVKGKMGKVDLWNILIVPSATY